MSYTNNRINMIKIGIGAFLILLGCLCNVWIIEKLATSDGSIDSNALKVVIWLFDVVSVATGFTFIICRRRIRLKNIALFIVSLILCLILAETILAMIGREPIYRIVFSVPKLVSWWSCDSVIGCRYIKDEIIKDKWRYNKDGFVDRDEFVESSVENNAFRILLLGDSFAAGAAATYKPGGKGFADILEDELKKAMKAVVWNTGIPGIGQKQQLLALKKYSPILKPDVVVLAFYINDFNDNLYPVGIHYVYEDGKWINRYVLSADFKATVLSPEAAYRRACEPRTLLQISRLFCTGLEAVKRFDDFINKVRRESKVSSKSISSTAGFDEVCHQDRPLAITLKLLEDIIKYVSTRNSKFIMLIIPARSDLYQKGEYYKKALWCCKKLGIDCIEVKDILNKDDYTNPPDNHWNQAGHTKAGKLLAKYLIKVMNESRPQKQFIQIDEKGS